MSAKDIDWAALYAQAEAERIAEKTEQILTDPDAYECLACEIEGQPCDVGLAVKVERKRIIKLLEHITQVGTECLMCGNDCSAERLIALIRGKNK